MAKAEKSAGNRYWRDCAGATRIFPALGGDLPAGQWIAGIAGDWSAVARSHLRQVGRAGRTASVVAMISV
ncbi:MAG: hypothetical protein MUE63_11805, partial [Xanthomonadales bacterium]|nr:hypothetical protein [Xanthomonadales bacterium]